MKPPMISGARFTQERDPLSVLRVPIPIDVVQVQSTATTVFTADDDADFLITTLIAANVSGGASSITLHIVPSSGSAATANKIIDAEAIPANEYISYASSEQQIILPPGSSLVALTATNDDVNIWGMGYRYQGAYSE